VANFSKTLFWRRVIVITIHTICFYWMPIAAVYRILYDKWVTRDLLLTLMVCVFMVIHMRMIYDSDLTRRPTD
jgi:hypothetical protein